MLIFEKACHCAKTHTGQKKKMTAPVLNEWGRKSGGESLGEKAVSPRFIIFAVSESSKPNGSVFRQQERTRFLSSERTDIFRRSSAQLVKRETGGHGPDIQRTGDQKQPRLRLMT